MSNDPSKKDFIEVVLNEDFENNCFQIPNGNINNIPESVVIPTQSIHPSYHCSTQNGSESQTDDSHKLRPNTLLSNGTGESQFPTQLDLNCQEDQRQNVSDDSSFYVMIDGNVLKRVNPGELNVDENNIEQYEIHLDEEHSSTLNTPNKTGDASQIKFPKKHKVSHGAEGDIERLRQNYKMNYEKDGDHNLNNSLGEENVLVHFSKQQQQYLNSAMNIGQDSIDESSGYMPMPMVYKTPEISYNQGHPMSDHYKILPNLLVPNRSNEQSPNSMAWTPSPSTQFVTPNMQSIYPSSLPGSVIQQQNAAFQTSTPVPCIYTPHPKTGQLLYFAQDTASPHLFQKLPPCESEKQDNSFVTPTLKTKEANSSKIILNSSGEESDKSQILEDPPTPSTSDKDLGKFDLFNGSGEGEDGREQHNMKERRRRARIKDACDVMRKLIPGMSDKTDKATVFEFGARYIHYLKSFVGNKHDKDFLIKYSPY